MKLRTNRVNKIISAMRPNSPEIEIDLDMDEGQMFDLLCVFLEHISGTTWEIWKERQREEVKEEEHE
mgnify:FL=1